MAKIVDFEKNNIHVLGYSAPVSKTIDFNKLKTIFIRLKMIKITCPIGLLTIKEWVFV